MSAIIKSFRVLLYARDENIMYIKSSSFGGKNKTRRKNNMISTPSHVKDIFTVH